MNKHIDLSTSSSTLRNKKNANRLEVINNFCRKFFFSSNIFLTSKWHMIK